MLHDYLYEIIDLEVYEDVMTNGRALIYCQGAGHQKKYMVPIEFSAAFFRFGHSMVRQTYPDWNGQGEDAGTQDLLSNTNTLEPLEHGRITDNWPVDWARLVGDFDPKSKLSRLSSASIDPALAYSLHELDPRFFNASDLKSLFGVELEEVSLAKVTLARGRSLCLPSAQRFWHVVDQKMPPGRPRPTMLTPDQIVNSVSDASFRKLLAEYGKADDGSDGSPFAEQTPLWLYTLLESMVLQSGQRLGPLASRVVMETIHAAIQTDSASIIDDKNALLELVPRLPMRGRHFKLSDLVAIVDENWSKRTLETALT